MTQTEKKLINEFVLGKISKEEFLTRYPVRLNGDYIVSELTEANNKRNQEDVEYFLSLIRFDEKFKETDKYVDILVTLLSTP